MRGNGHPAAPYSIDTTSCLLSVCQQLICWLTASSACLALALSGLQNFMLSHYIDLLKNRYSYVDLPGTTYSRCNLEFCCYDTNWWQCQWLLYAFFKSDLVWSIGYKSITIIACLPKSTKFSEAYITSSLYTCRSTQYRYSAYTCRPTS